MLYGRHHVSKYTNLYIQLAIHHFSPILYTIRLLLFPLPTRTHSCPQGMHIHLQQGDRLWIHSPTDPLASSNTEHSCIIAPTVPLDSEHGDGFPIFASRGRLCWGQEIVCRRSIRAIQAKVWYRHPHPAGSELYGLLLLRWCTAGGFGTTYLPDGIGNKIRIRLAQGKARLKYPIINQ